MVGCGVGCPDGVVVGLDVVGLREGDLVVGRLVGFGVGAADGELVVGVLDGELVVGADEGALLGERDGDSVMLGITGKPKTRLFCVSTT